MFAQCSGCVLGGGGWGEAQLPRMPWLTEEKGSVAGRGSRPFTRTAGGDRDVMSNKGVQLNQTNFTKHHYDHETVSRPDRRFGSRERAILSTLNYFHGNG